MRGYRRSYLKTTILAAGLGPALVLLTVLAASGRSGAGKLLLEAVAFAGGMAGTSVALGGLTVICRERRQRRGQTDLFLARNAARSEEVIACGHLDIGLRMRRLLRRLLGARWVLVGDPVEVLSAADIRRTLDVHGCTEDLPFMTEMAKFCGQRAYVFRVVDKVYDYAATKTFRRLQGTVLLAGLRCDGGDHGQCQACCYLLWKTAWLRPLSGTGITDASTGAPSMTEHPGLIGAVPFMDGPRGRRYTCQYTQLSAATRALAPWDIRQDLRPLLHGNVTVTAFCIALLTRLFTVTQALRGGVGYPPLPRGQKVTSITSTPSLALEPGTTVEVMSSEAIASTLDTRGRNHGLWFDREMTKHCGRRYPILGRVERVIDGATGSMLRIRTPCLILAGVDASGEFLRFCAQHEYPFWRQAWLKPVGPTDPGEPTRGSCP